MYEWVRKQNAEPFWNLINRINNLGVLIEYRMF